jgi:flagellar biosynthesis protein FlhG
MTEASRETRLNTESQSGKGCLVMESENPAIASIASGKGGVGKTFITANIATSFAMDGKKVLVVDCDLGLANMDVLLGVSPRFTLQDIVFGDRSVRDVIISTKAGFDLIPATSGVKEMAQLLYEKLQLMKSALESIFVEYDQVILDTGAGISEVVLQFNLFAPKNIIVLNKEPTTLTDAYAVIKLMHQRFGRHSFGIIVNSARDEKEASRTFGHMDSVCRQFLGFPLNYLGYIINDGAVPRSILNREILVHASPECKAAINCSGIARAISRWE